MAGLEELEQASKQYHSVHLRLVSYVGRVEMIKTLDKTSVVVDVCLFRRSISKHSSRRVIPYIGRSVEATCRHHPHRSDTIEVAQSTEQHDLLIPEMLRCCQV